MTIKKCFFCDKIIVPLTMITTIEINNFFKDHNLEFTLNYTRSKTTIGNKIICLSCERDIRNIVDEECECEKCREEEQEIDIYIERKGE